MQWGAAPLTCATCNLLIITLCLLLNHTIFFSLLLFRVFQLPEALKQSPSLSDNITIVLLTYCHSSESFCYLNGL